MYKNTLTIYSPINLASYNISTDIYNSSNNTITFSVLSGNYQRIEEGSKKEIINTSTGVYIGQHKIRIGFTAKLQYTDLKLPLVITKIAEHSWDNNLDIKIRDRRRIELNTTDFNNKYTDRLGKIFLPLEVSDILTTTYQETQVIAGIPTLVDIDEQYLEDGFTIIFKETGLR
jgi:hypothetical protein